MYFKPMTTWSFTHFAPAFTQPQNDLPPLIVANRVDSACVICHLTPPSLFARYTASGLLRQQAATHWCSIRSGA